MRSVTAPNVMDGLDKSLLGKDMLPSVKETLKVIDERSVSVDALAVQQAWMEPESRRHLDDVVARSLARRLERPQ